MTAILVTAGFDPDITIFGTSNSPLTGYENSSYSTGSTVPTPPVVSGTTILAAGSYSAFGTAGWTLVMDTGTAQNLFDSVSTLHSGTLTTFLSTQALFFSIGQNIVISASVLGTAQAATWLWPDAGHDFANKTITTLNFAQSAPSAPSGNGDITDPEAWQDSNGNIPPAEFSNVPYNVNFPLNGDGRYWFSVNASTADSGSPITFIGDEGFFTGEANLQWSVVSTANDGSGLVLAYSTDGATWNTSTLLPQTQLNGIQNGAVPVGLAGATVFQVKVYAQGGTATAGATFSEVAIAITRNFNEQITWDNPNPFNPVNYNALVVDNNVNTATMASLSARILVRLGFANQASNPPPGMALLVQDFLTSAQTFLYKRYLQLHTKRLFRWKVNPGQRFYSLKDNDENVKEGVNMDPTRTIEWAGIQDSRNVWYPLIQGIPPQLYTMITKPWRPARYELRGAIELYPAPDQTYWLWVKGHFGLMSFINPSDITTIDSELVFLHALANAKAHYGQPDANNIESQANAYRAELIAATHQTAHYLPGTIAVPPAVRPTLIQFDANNGGGS